MGSKYQEFVPPSDEEIATYAYYLWEAEGRQPGRDLAYWLEAKAHLTVDRQYEAGLLRPPDAKETPSRPQAAVGAPKRKAPPA